MPTRFTKVGDAHVAYHTWGDGPIDLLYFEEIPVDMSKTSRVSPRQSIACRRSVA
ncbi:MAG TPA: hypothetical protein VFA34_17020 [Actinomycetota bacterium]|nr:hypothetical protein [Actinomycetota bacterium]